MKTKPFCMSKILSGALAGAMMLALAQARAVTVTGANVTAAPGSPFEVAFDFDFGADTGVSSFSLDLTFDATQVTFAGLSRATYQATGYTSSAVAAALAGAGTYTEATDASGFHATWFALDSNLQPMPALHLSGHAQVVYSFSLTAAAMPNSSTDVGVLLTYSDAALNPVDPVGHTVTVTVTAVPEPGAWVLLAAGLGVFGAAAWRGQRPRSLS